MPIWQRALVIGVTLALGAGMPPGADGQVPPNDAVSLLIDQGKYWQEQQRGDLAEQAWLKVLGVDPRQPDALYGMGVVMIDRQDGTGAQQYLARLRQARPDSPYIDELNRRLGQASPTDQAVNHARSLAQAGQQAFAAQAYRQALGPRPANPQLALEFYQALGSTPQGWDEARRGLKALTQQHTNEPRFALAYAQHLSFREATRRDGVAQLAQLSQDLTVGAQARTSWRQALLWLDVRASDAPLFQAYLLAVPDDVAVKSRADSITGEKRRTRTQHGDASDLFGHTVADGFAALDHDDLTKAKASFSSALALSPNDGNALGGAGIVLLRQQQFAQAREYLRRASQGSGAAHWQEALDTATYWMYMTEGFGEQSDGHLAQAKASFEKAIAVSRGDATAQAALGNLLMQDDPRGAETAYRVALRQQADNPEAIRGLVTALAAQGRYDEALSFIGQPGAQQEAGSSGAGRLRSVVQTAQARAAGARGDWDTSRSLFESALQGSPDDPWLRLELARVYARQGAYAKANSTMTDLHPETPDAFFASALLAADMLDWASGLALLEHIPTGRRTDAMTKLQRRMWVHLQVEEAVTFAKNGRTGQAYAALANAEPVADSNTELVGVVARGYVTLGDAPRALVLVRSALEHTPDDPGLLLTEAGMLLDAGQDTGLGDVMRRLAPMQLTQQQRTDFEKINVVITLRRSDALRRTNDLAGAYAVLAPWLAAQPENPDLLAALARLYSAGNDHASALVAYRLALSHKPTDLGLLLSAAGTATQLREFAFAESSLGQALRIAPDSPDVLATAGRLYHAQGRYSLAAQFLQRALAAQGMPPINSRSAMATDVNGPVTPGSRDEPLSARGPIPLPGTNPFAERTSVDPVDSVSTGVQNTGSVGQPMQTQAGDTLPVQTVNVR